MIRPDGERGAGLRQVSGDHRSCDSVRSRPSSISIRFDFELNVNGTSSTYWQLQLGPSRMRSAVGGGINGRICLMLVKVKGKGVALSAGGEVEWYEPAKTGCRI